MIIKKQLIRVNKADTFRKVVAIYLEKYLYRCVLIRKEVAQQMIHVRVTGAEKKRNLQAIR